MKQKREFHNGHLGNGLTVWIADTNTVVAHISPDREITYRMDVTEEEKWEIEKLAKGDDRSVSVSQPKIKVFNRRPI